MSADTKTPPTVEVEPIDATTWGHPIFSDNVRKTFRESVPGTRFNQLRPLVDAVHEIVRAELNALYHREGIDPRTWHVEGCGEHLNDALTHLDNALSEYRRARGVGFPNGADAKEGGRESR